MENILEDCTIKTNISYLKFPCDSCECTEDKFHQCLKVALEEINRSNEWEQNAVV